MKALTNDELAMIASDLQELVGAQLQEAQMTETEFGLGFYHDRKMVWLWFDMDPRRPVLLRFEDRPPSRPKLTKPLLLFARAHLLGRRLMSVAMNVALGRVLEFVFHDPGGETRRLEARLFPHGQNLAVFAGPKSLSFGKPKELASAPTVPHVATDLSATASTIVSEQGRRWEQIRDEWLAVRRGTRPKAAAGSSSSSTASASAAAPAGASSSGLSDIERAQRDWEKVCAKKAQALDKMRADLEAKSDPSWRQAGEWLKGEGSLNDLHHAPPALRERIDASRSLSWNIETCFHKAKENERKLEGAQERIRILEAELAQLRDTGPEKYLQDQRARGAKATAQGAANRTSLPSLLEKAGARGRKLTIGTDLEAYIGKSAGDNIALLRRAQPHDLWLHLRDYPGAHAILRRPKNRLVSDRELNEVGQWVVMQSLHKSASELEGGRYDMILAECRHVKPIKGDKLGRVTYQNDRLFVVRL